MSEDSRQVKSEGDNPRFLSDVKQSKVIFLYLNGDKWFRGKRYCLKDKNFEGFLQSCTDSLLPRFGCIRTINTPRTGKRITRLEDIVDRGKYVGCGQPKFKQVGYEEIEPLSNKTPRKQAKAPPVGTHNKQYKNIESRVNYNNPKQGKNIHIQQNGKTNEPSHSVLIRPAILENPSMEALLREIAERLDPYYIRVHRLFTKDGEEIHHPSQIQQNECYVAIENNRYIPGHYKVTTEPRNFTTSRGQGYDPKKGLRPKTWTSRGHLAPLKPSPNHSVSSNPEYGSRRHHAKKREDNGAPHSSAKIHNVKNKSKGHHGPPPSKQNDHILTNGNDHSPFKATKTNEATKGARTVNDTRDTRTEVPIDQRPAETVKEETLDGLDDADSMSLGSTAIELNRRPSDESDHFQEEKIKGSNSKRSDSITHHDKKLNPHEPLPAIQKKPDSRENETPSPQAKKDMSEEDAAVTIQAAFRGHQDRKMIEEKKKETQEKKSDPPKADSPKAKDTKDDKKQQGMSEDEAATKIQASIRGHQARKEVQQMKEQKEQEKDFYN